MIDLVELDARVQRLRPLMKVDLSPSAENFGFALQVMQIEATLALAQQTSRLADYAGLQRV